MKSAAPSLDSTLSGRLWQTIVRNPHAFVALEEGDHRQEVRSPWIPRGSNMRKIAQGGLPTGSTTHLNRAQIVQREAVGS